MLKIINQMDYISRKRLPKQIKIMKIIILQQISRFINMQIILRALINQKLQNQTNYNYQSMQAVQKWINQCLQNKNNALQTTSNPPSIKIHHLTNKQTPKTPSKPKSYHNLTPSKQKSIHSQNHKRRDQNRLNTASSQKANAYLVGPYQPILVKYQSKQDSKIKIVSKMTARKPNIMSAETKRQILLKQSQLRNNQTDCLMQKSNNSFKQNLTISISEKQKQQQYLQTSKNESKKAQNLYIAPCFTPQHYRNYSNSNQNNFSTDIQINNTKGINFFQSNKAKKSNTHLKTQIKTISSFHQSKNEKDKSIHEIDTILKIQKVNNLQSTQFFSSRLPQPNHCFETQNVKPTIQTSRQDDNEQLRIDQLSQVKQNHQINIQDNSQQSDVRISISSSQASMRINYISNIFLKQSQIHSQGRFMTNYYAKIQPINFLFIYREVTPIIMNNHYLEHKIKAVLQICSRISHPNMLKIYYGYLFKSGNLAICTQIAQYSLLSLINNKRKRFDEKLIKKILKQILSFISFLHHFTGVGIVHGNIKPSNIFFVNDSVKLQWMGYEDSIISAYVAPQIRRGAPPCKKSDIWSIGVITYLMFYGELPQWIAQKLSSSCSQVSLQSKQMSPIDNYVSKFTISKNSQQKISQPITRKFDFFPKAQNQFFEDVRISESKQLLQKDFIDKKIHLSSNIKDFMFRTMNQNQFERMTALQCLSHPFLNQSSRNRCKTTKQ